MMFWGMSINSKLKVKLPRWVAESGVDIFLQSSVVDVITEPEGVRGLIIIKYFKNDGFAYHQ